MAVTRRRPRAATPMYCRACLNTVETPEVERLGRRRARCAVCGRRRQCLAFEDLADLIATLAAQRTTA